MAKTALMPKHPAFPTAINLCHGAGRRDNGVLSTDDVPPRGIFAMGKILVSWDEAAFKAAAERLQTFLSNSTDVRFKRVNALEALTQALGLARNWNTLQAQLTAADDKIIGEDALALQALVGQLAGLVGKMALAAADELGPENLAAIEALEAAIEQFAGV
jgi:hypothetical protein